MKKQQIYDGVQTNLQSHGRVCVLGGGEGWLKAANVDWSKVQRCKKVNVFLVSALLCVAPSSFTAAKNSPRVLRIFLRAETFGPFFVIWQKKLKSMTMPPTGGSIRLKSIVRVWPGFDR